MPLQIRCDNRPIFQAKHVSTIRTKIFTRLADVREAYIATHKMKSDQEKSDYFMSVGLDYQRTKDYYATVIELNRLWDLTKIETPKKDLFTQLIEFFK